MKLPHGRVALLAVFLAVLVLIPVRVSRAANGMNMIGYGADSIAMGGADLAVVSTPSSMNINPAGIGQILEPGLDLGLSLMNPNLTHTDGLGNNQSDVLDRFPIPYIGYVHPVGSVTLGVGLFVQGGMGAEYQDLSTPFSAMSGSVPPGFFTGDSVPEADATLTNLRHVKLTPTVAWRVRPGLVLGASLNVSYARANMKLFPDTSIMADMDMSGVEGDSPSDFFFGMDMQGMSALGYGVRVGFQYKRRAFALGGAYSTQTGLDFDGGTMNMNLTSMGMGVVAYDARMNDFHWARQAGLGMAYRFNPKVMVAADVDWIDWESAIRTVTLEATNPDTLSAPPVTEIPFVMDWNEQWVWAAGLEVRPTGQDWALRFGYNHGDSPVPGPSLRPLFPAIAEDHITGGAGFTVGSWTVDLAMEYAFRTEKTNDSLDRRVNPFGPGSQESLSQFMAHIMVRHALFSDRGGKRER